MLDVTKAHPLRPTTLAHRVSNIRLSTLHRISEPAFNDCPSTNLIRAFYTLAAFVAVLRDARCGGAATLVSFAAGGATARPTTKPQRLPRPASKGWFVVLHPFPAYTPARQSRRHNGQCLVRPPHDQRLTTPSLAGRFSRASWTVRTPPSTAP
jgi:hypothetical protein